MNKDILKVKKLLHLDLFTRIKWRRDVEIILLDPKGIEDNYMDFHFHKLARILGEKSPGDYCFSGGNHKTIFFLKYHESSNSSHFSVYYHANCDKKKAMLDLPLLKEFIKDQYKKVSRG